MPCVVVSSTTMASLKIIYIRVVWIFMYKPTTRMWQPTLPSFLKITVLGSALGCTWLDDRVVARRRVRASHSLQVRSGRGI